MKKQDIESALLRILQLQEFALEPDQFTTPLKDLGMDSLEHVELCLNVEKLFSIVITNDELDTLSTFNDWVEIILEKKSITV